jgi:hypothetical protein
MRQQMILQNENRNSKIYKKLTHHRRSNSWLSDYIESVSIDESEKNNNNKCVTHKLKRRGNASSSSGNKQ